MYVSVAGGPFRGLREQQISYKFEDGSLLLKTLVADRVVELNTEGINGRRSLQIRLLNGNGTKAIPLADEQNQRDEKVSLFSAEPNNRFAPLRFVKDKDSVIGELVLDGTPVEDLKLDNYVEKVYAGTTILKPYARMRARSLDQAPVARVAFFIADVPFNDEIPKGIVPIEGNYDAALKAWIVKEEMAVPEELRGTKLYLGVQATTATGVSTTRKVQLALFKGPPPLPTVATIIGVVMRGKYQQPDTLVSLTKVEPGKAHVPLRTQTNETGGFEFKDVAPGEYKLLAKRQGAEANIPVTVPRGKDKVGVLQINLQAVIR